MRTAHTRQSRKHLISIDDGAAYLGVTPKTIRRMIASGELTGYRVGKKIIRIKQSDLDALLRPIPNAKTVVAG